MTAYARIERGDAAMVFRMRGHKKRYSRGEVEREGVPIAIRETANGFWKPVPGVTDARYNPSAQWTRSLELVPLATDRVDPLPCRPVHLVIAAKAWRERLHSVARDRVIASAGLPSFPDEGDEALAVFGPLEAYGIAAMVLHEVAADCGVSFREVSV